MDEKYISLTSIEFVYIIVIVLWIALIYYLDLFTVGTLGIILVILPIVIFGFSAYNHGYHTDDLLHEIIRADYLSFVVLAIILMINWSRAERKERIFKIIFIAILFLMLSILDIVGDSEEMRIYRTIKAAFQTIAITLILLALYVYYMEIEVDYKKGTIEPGTTSFLYGGSDE